MRRRPEEDDQEEPERRQRQVARRGGEADERRNRAGGAADDDVLHRGALEVARVDDDVEEVADEREDRGQHVDRAGEQRERERREDEAELQRARRRDPARGDRAALGARAHQPVDVGVEHVVEGARASAGERETHHRRRRTCPSAGMPSAPTNMPAAPVISRSDMMRGLVSVT